MGLDVLAVGVLFILKLNKALVVHKGKNVIVEALLVASLFKGCLVGLLKVGFLGTGVVGTKLLAEQLEREVVVCKQVLVGNCALIVGDRFLVSGGQNVACNGSLHLCLGHLGGVVSGLVSVVNVDQLLDTVACHGVGAGGDVVTGGIVVCNVLLGSVRSQTNDIGGVHGRGAGVDGVKINVEVKENVIHGQRLAVREGNAVLQNEGVGGEVGFLVIGADVVLYNNRLVVTERNGNLTVFVSGGQHTDLRHANDGTVGSRSGEEGVEQTVKLVGHQNERIGLGGGVCVHAACTAGKRDQRSQHHCGAEQNRNKSS